MVAHAFQILLLRVLLDPMNRRDGIAVRKKRIFCVSVQLFTTIIFLLFLSVFIYLIVNNEEINLFSKDSDKTTLLFWIEIQFWKTPIQLVYYMFTLYHLMLNRKEKKANLNIPQIKEVITDEDELKK